MEYGLIGKPLSHSFSKSIHEKFGYRYEIRELNERELEAFLIKKDFKGINVTIPYKEKVIPYLDEIENNAKKIGAVNTILNKNGKLYGYNTDYIGAKLLIEKQKTDVSEKKALILGTGGTSKTFFSVLSDMGAEPIIKVSRNPKNDEISYSDAISKHKDARIIINTTPVGMYPKCDDFPLDIDEFEDISLVIDAVYNPLRTRLVQKAEEKNIKSAGGLYMLVEQAVYASKIFGNKSENSDIYNEILHEKRNIVLIGMPGAGKTTIASTLDKNFVDTDIEIEKKYQMSCCEIITKYGEKSFREKESNVIKEVAELNGKVIATGGGAVLNEENIINLKKNGIIIFLKKSLEDLNVGKKRPLAKTEDELKSLYEARRNIYPRCCDIEIDADKSIDDIQMSIRKELSEYENIDY